MLIDRIKELEAIKRNLHDPQSWYYKQVKGLIEMNCYYLDILNGKIIHLKDEY
jgi:phenylalanine-4-hydroxylase